MNYEKYLPQRERAFCLTSCPWMDGGAGVVADPLLSFGGVVGASTGRFMLCQ